tara:strand:+ start:494 stop:745 length:252 start_codon:yes stop_codon:yes gene_type:complete
MSSASTIKVSKKYDRFDLEECITSLYQINEDLQIMIEKEFDTKEGLTEDEKLNIINGLMDLHKIKCDKAFKVMAELISQKNLK